MKNNDIIGLLAIIIILIFIAARAGI